MGDVLPPSAEGRHFSQAGFSDYNNLSFFLSIHADLQTIGFPLEEKRTTGFSKFLLRPKQSSTHTTNSIHHIMKKKVFYVVSAMAAVLLASCSQDEYNRTSPKDNIVATIHPAATTRTAVDQPVESAQAVGIAWTDGDQIGVFDHESVTQRCYSKVGAEREALASFTAVGEAFAEPTYAYYPYDSANDNKEITSLTGNLPTVQNMDSGILHGDYKYGRAKGSGASGHEFAFTHMFSLARVTVDASGTPLAGEKLREVSVSVTRDDAPVAVAGQFEFNARNGVWMQTDAGSGTVSLQWTDGPQLNSSLTAYMSMFPTVKSGDTFTITVSTQNYRACFSAQSRADFQRENIYGLPLLLKNYSSLVVYDNEGNLKYPTEGVETGTFTCATLNVDGLPSSINKDGPGEQGTVILGNKANSLGWDFLAVSEDFEYHTQLATAMSNYNAGKYRGSLGVLNLSQRADTDGLGFFWKKGLNATGETMVQYTAEIGGLTDGANTLIKKGFRHYVVTVADGVDVDVYITHMNTWSDKNPSSFDPVQIAQLCQLRDYVLAQLKQNKRPAIVMGDTNMRYTRHKVQDNFFTPIAQAGYEAIDPWVKFHRNGKFPTWGGKSLMIRSNFKGDTKNDICCSDDQRGEVVDKVWYINHPLSSVQLQAMGCRNDVGNFEKSTEAAEYKGVDTEDANGNILTNQTVSFERKIGLADHFPVVVDFKYTIIKK